VSACKSLIVLSSDVYTKDLTYNKRHTISNANPPLATSTTATTAADTAAATAAAAAAAAATTTTTR